MEGVGGFRLQTFPQRAEAQSSPAGCLCCSCINNTIILALYYIVYHIGIVIYCIILVLIYIVYHIGIVLVNVV